MLMLPGLGILIFLSVHAFTDEQIRSTRIFHDGRYGSGVSTVSQFDTFSRWSKHHIRRVDRLLVSDSLTLLQTAPILLWNILLHGFLKLKFACPIQFQGMQKS